MVAKELKEKKKHSNTAIENLSLNIIQKSLESSSVGIVITNFLEADNPIVYVNPHFEELTGYKFKEVVGKNCRFLRGDDKKQDELKIVKRAIKQGKSCNTILRNYRKDGSLFYNELSLSPISDNGQVTHFIGFQKNVTPLIQELQKANKLKYELNNKIDALCEHSTEQIWRIDLIPPISLSAPIKTQIKQIFERGVFTEANDLTARGYGFKKGNEIVGKHLNEFLNYNIAPNFEAMKNVVENKFYLKNILSFEKTKKGDTVVLLNNVKPEIEDNRVKWVWGTSRNITELHNVNAELEKTNEALRYKIAEHKAASKALKESLERLEIINEYSSEDIYRIDLIPPISLDDPVETQVKQIFERAVFMEANDNQAATYGYKKGSELIGKPLRKFFSSENPKNVESMREYALSKFHMKDVITHEKTLEGKDIVLYNNIKPQIKDNKVAFVFGNARDITELHNLTTELEKTNEALRYKIAEHKKAEEELKLSEQKYKNILSNLPDLVSRNEFKPERGFSFISGPAEKIFGYTNEEFYADPDLILKIIHPDDIHLIDTFFEWLVNHEMPLIMRYIHKNGKTVVTEVRGTPIYNDQGELIANEAITRDITEWYNLNKDLEKANKFLEEQKQELANKNIALSEVIGQVEKEKIDVVNKVKNNLETFILPTIEKLKLSTDENHQLELLRNSVKDLFSEFGVKITGNKEKLTQREIEICNLVKNGFSNKDIANNLNISIHTVEKHRRTVRVKLGIVNKKDSLYTYLNSM